MTDKVKAPLWFWIVAIVALVWNLMGVGAYLTQVFMSAEDLEVLDEATRNLYETTPAWATAAFAIAVWGGAVACILLLMRKSLAASFFLISLLGIIVQQIHAFFFSKSWEVFGPGGMVMPIMVLVFAILLVFLARSASRKGWIN